MANENRSNTVDTLALKISVDKLTQSKVDVVNNLASAIETLNKAVKDTSGIKSYVAELNKVAKILGSIKTTTPKTPKAQTTGGEEPKIGTANISNEVLKTEEEIVSVQKEQTNEQKTQLTNLDKKKKKIAEDTKAQKDNNKEVKKSATLWSKLSRSIVRVAFYRAIRTSIKEIVDAVQFGIKNVAQFDDETNKAMSDIMNSATQLKNTLGVSFSYILKAISPAIISLSDSIVSLIDNLNMALASMSGKSTYLKAKKGMDDYAESIKNANSQLLSFDKFETLSKGDTTNISDMFEETKVPEELNSTAETFVEIIKIVETLANSLKELKPVLNSLLGITFNILKIVSSIINVFIEKSNIVSYINKIAESINRLNAFLEKNKWIYDLLSVSVEIGLTMMTGGLYAIIVYWDKIVLFFKNTCKKIGDFFSNLWKGIANGFAKIINGISNGFIEFINNLIDGLNLVLKPLDLIAGIFGGKVKIPNWNATVNWRPYADGGMVDTGTKFIAGEAGAEIVHQGSRGTGVANVEQIAEANYKGTLRALYEYGAARNSNNTSGDVVLKVDSKEFARATVGATANALNRNYRVDFQPR